MAKRKRAAAKPAPKRAGNPLYNPDANLRGKTIKTIANTVIKGTYEPQQHALQQQASDVKTQDTALANRAGDYYTQLAQREAQGVAREQALGNLLDQKIGSINDNAHVDAKDVHAAQQQDAEHLGLASNTAGEEAALEARQQALGSSARSGAAESSTNWAQLANAMADARQLRGGEIQGELLNKSANDQGKVRDQIRDLASKRAADKMKTILDLRGQGAANDLARQKITADLSIATGKLLTAKQIAKINAATRQSVAQTQAGATTTSAQTRADATTTAAQTRATATVDAANARARAQEKANRQKQTAAQRKANQKVWGDVTGWVQKVRAGLQVPKDPTDPKKGYRPATHTEEVRQLRSEGVPEWQIKVITDLRKGNRLSSQTISFIHNNAPGVTIPDQYMPQAGDVIRRTPGGVKIHKRRPSRGTAGGDPAGRFG